MDFKIFATYPAPLNQVLDMVTDPDFQRARFSELPATLESVDVQDVADNRVQVTTLVSVQGDDLDLPAVAKKFVPSQGVKVAIRETWDTSSGSCTMDFDLGSLPGSVKARSQLIDEGEQVQREFHGQVKVTLPLVGAKLEKTAVKNMKQVVAAEETAARRYLQTKS